MEPSEAGQVPSRKALIADANTTTKQTELQEQVSHERKKPKRVHLGNGLVSMQDENEDTIMEATGWRRIRDWGQPREVDTDKTAYRPPVTRS